MTTADASPVREAETHFSERSFWKKVGKVFEKLGRETTEKLLVLFYAYKEPGVPLWAKSAIVGALGYFVWPLDLIPDMIPAAGYVDDLGVLVAALGVVAVHITPEVRAKASEKLADWFD